MDKLLDKIVNKQLSDGVISKEDVPVYRYGYLLLFETLANIVAGIVVGVLFQQLCVVFIFWIGYMPLRSYAGGWHASTFFKCFLVSNLWLIIAVVVIKFFEVPINIWTIIVDALCILIICVLSPVDTESKPLDTEERKKYKAKTIVILITHIVIICIWKKVWEILICVHVILAIALMAQCIKNRKCRRER